MEQPTALNLHCTGCGRRRHGSEAFCPSCGRALTPIAPAAPAPADAPPPPSPSLPAQWRQSAMVTLAGGVMLVVGALLPWATITSGLGSVSLAGTDGDGIFLLGLGAIIAAASLGYLNGNRTARAGASLLGIIAIWLMVNEVGHVARVVDEANSDYTRGSIGIGVWVCLLGALLSAGAPLFAGRSDR